MGCDIHWHAEVKINGKWQHYAHSHVGRNYRLFALMADVRNDGSIDPISEPKGLPKDVTESTKFDADKWGEDGHSHSYLTSKELVKLEDAWEKIVDQIIKDELASTRLDYDLEYNIFHSYLYGNSYAGFHKYPKDRPKGIEDVRWVFWFDN